ncbi:MAG: hypothetical protein IJB73_04595 [Firmicutes bacterium]|nr:hypothetical protein [Bacillota bacterium]
MFEKMVKKEGMTRLIVFILIGSVLILTLNVLFTSKDNRRQIIDQDGGSEERLCSVLSSISGVGDVDVMIEYDNNSRVSGVIVTAEGGSDPVIASNLTRAVTTLYGIPVSGVIVFEKEQEE